MAAAKVLQNDLMAGQDIFVKGSSADAFFVLVQGTVEISTTGDSGDRRAIAKLSAVLDANPEIAREG